MDPATARHTAAYHGRMIAFCAPSRKKRFLADPQAYPTRMSNAGAQPAQQACTIGWRSLAAARAMSAAMTVVTTRPMPPTRVQGSGG